MSRSIEMLAVIYGIIKAGGAYVPLDTKYPSERIAYIVQEIKPVCMIADDTTTLYTDFDINVITKDEIKEIAKMEINQTVINHVMTVWPILYILQDLLGNPRV